METKAQKFSWRQAPDLMTRLAACQNNLRAPIDIMTFAAFCETREQLRKHVAFYEEKILEGAL